MKRTELLTALFVLKLISCAFAWFVVGKFIKLGDTQDYINGYYLFRDDFLSTAYLMSLLGSYFTKFLGSSFIANFPLVIAAWWGLVKSTEMLTLSKSQWFALFIMFLSPSNLLWTSIHSKEAIVSLFFCVLIYYVISLHLKRNITLFMKGVVIASFVGLILFKPYYVPAVMWLILFTKGISNAKYKKLWISVVLLAALSIVTIFLSAFHEVFNELSSTFHLHFSTEGNLTRSWGHWSGLFDMLKSIPFGMLISFIGPTIYEVFSSISLLPFFLEGVLSLLVIIYLLYRSCVRNGMLNLTLFFMLGGFFLLLLIAHFPFGYFNPGSALRYKQSFYAALLILFFFFAYDKKLKLIRVYKNI